MSNREMRGWMVAAGLLGASAPGGAWASAGGDAATLAMMGLIYPMMLGGPVLAIALVLWARRHDVGSTGARAAVAVVALIVPFLGAMMGGGLMEQARSLGDAAPLLFFGVFAAVVYGYAALAARWLRATTAER